MSVNPRLSSPDLSGRVALVTGSSRGIGRECALALARCGAKVVVAAKTIDPTPTLPGESVDFFGLEVIGMVKDAGERIDANLFSPIELVEISEMFQNRKPDFPCNCAARRAELTGVGFLRFDLITSINSRGSFIMTKLCLPYMKENKFGRVINMSPPISTDFARIM
ncbi:hypothetical protein FOL47_002919 [Perkinsus chesapeaki]|uniref:Dehydrogenase reductase SDR member 4 n=1 Tax=Perkinsus chesapeaki TaxID=330153 RepID=A0A7J6MAU3_PERCH|nr:hypothetical protein FOL47_002919 [Perkinsus chesapeaki]